MAHGWLYHLPKKCTISRPSVFISPLMDTADLTKSSPNSFLPFVINSISKAVLYIRPHSPILDKWALWPSILCSNSSTVSKTREILVSVLSEIKLHSTGRLGPWDPWLTYLPASFLFSYLYFLSVPTHPQLSLSVKKKRKTKLDKSNFQQLSPPVKIYYNTVTWNWSNARSPSCSLQQRLWGKVSTNV